MSHFIITAIIALAAAKAKSQVKDNLTKPECRVQEKNLMASEGLLIKGGSMKNRVNPVFNERKHLIRQGCN